MLSLWQIIKTSNFSEHVQGKLTTITYRLSYMTFHYQGRDLILSLFTACWQFLWLIFPVTFWCRLNIPPHMLPQTSHPTTLSLLHCENHTVVNVLIDIVSSLFLWLKHYLLLHTVDLPNSTHDCSTIFCFQGSVERQVLVRNYEEGTKVAFDQRIPNLKEVYTLDSPKVKM